MENNIKLAKLTQYTPMICSLLGIIAHLGMTSEHVECPECKY